MLRSVFLFSALAVMALGQAATARAQAAGGNLGLQAEALRRLQLAGQIIVLNPPQEALKTSNLAASPMFAQVMARLDPNRLNQLAAQLMAQTFTSQELAALLAFQQTPAGRSIQQKMPAYQKMLGAVMQNELNAAFQGYVASQGSASGLGASGLPAAVPALPAGGLSGSGTPTGR